MENEKKSNNTKITGITISVIVGVLLLFALGFHFVPSRSRMFPKDNFTFSYTIITESDIHDLLERHNSANFFEKNVIKQEPLFRKLADKGIIYEEDNKDE